MTTTLIDREQLVAAARAVREHAYAPYSHYHVGAAVQVADRRIFTGVNVENAVYPLTICAERAAIFTAVSSGARQIVAAAVVTSNGGTPCGSCRQVLREFGTPEMPVLIARPEGDYRELTLGELLPESFSAQDLAVAQQL